MILEENKRLSQSLLWKLQNEAYQQFGPRAWSQKGVPCYLTSNPLIAKYYAHIALAFLQDCAAADAIEWDAPFYCFDLGAGIGRLAYLFLKEFLPLLHAVPFCKKLQLCYVMTDISEENRQFWRQHSQLAPYFNAGILECSSYRHDTKNTKMHLEHSHNDIELSSLTNPCLVIANYFFDTIPQDLFKISHGKLYEGHATLKANVDSDMQFNLDMPDPAVIPNLQITWDYSELSADESRNYYAECKSAQNILDYYLQTFEDLTFLLPLGACQSLDFFRDCSKNRLLLLASDQGVVTKEQLKEWKDPVISLHGSFSLPVSYHAIAYYFYKALGRPFLTDCSDPLFVGMAAAIEKDVAEFSLTKIAFTSSINAFEPKDYWKLVEEGMQRSTPTLEEILIWIKLGNWDPTNFHAFFGTIRAAITTATNTQKIQLLHTIERVYENFFLVEASDAIFLTNLALLCYELQCPERALFFFKQSPAIAIMHTQ